MNIKDKKWITVQFISFLRPLGALLVFWFFSHEKRVANSSYYLMKYLLFFIIFFSDFLDGKLARKWNVTSRFGGVWDPICDKFTIYIMFFACGSEDYYLFCTLIFKDLLVFVGGLYTQYYWKKSIYTALGRSTMLFTALYLMNYIIKKDFNILGNQLFFIKNLTHLVFCTYIVEYIYKLGTGLWKKKI